MRLLLLAGLALLAAPLQSAAAPVLSRTPVPLRDGEPADAVVERLMNLWPQADSGERMEIARVLGVMKASSAADLLLHCSLERGPEASSCMMALVVMDHLDAVPAFRQLLRTSLDPMTVAVASLGLARWRDRFSYSLLVKTLLEGAGRELGGVALARAVDSLGDRWKHRYLRMAMEDTPYPVVRLTISAILAERGAGATKREAVGQLRRNLEESLLYSFWSERDRVSAALGAWGLSRSSSDDCRFLTDILEQALERPELEEERVDGLLTAISWDCLFKQMNRLPRLKSLALGKGLMPGLGRRELPEQEFPLPCPDGDKCNIGTTGITRIAGRISEISSTEEAAQILESAMVRGNRLVAAAGWRPFSAMDSSSRTRYPRKTWDQLHKLAPGENLPLEFNQSLPSFNQPYWFPSNISLTIDDGPRPLRLVPLLDVLDKYQVKASFFFIGTNVVSAWLKDPEGTRALFERIIRRGHMIGYHTMNHDTVWTLHIQAWEPEQIQDDIALFRLVLDRILGWEYPLRYSRCPGGMGTMLPWVRQAFFRSGLAASAAWNAGDAAWMPGSSSAVIRALARKYAQKTSPVVILIHETFNIHKEVETFLSELKGLSR